MPIINLTIRGKQAMGDGTKIVCMNSDYKVRITYKDCDTFEQAPVKKLVVKCGHEYREAPIETVTDDGQQYAQADLPIIERQSTIELGVYGTTNESPDPIYTSKPALFECSKSILCGAAVLKTDPVLTALDVTENGKYRASDRNVDGFHEVNVQVSSKFEEVRDNVDLYLAAGDQVIDPTGSNRTMSRVVVKRPLNFLPENIRKNITIAGVQGLYECTDPHYHEVEKIPDNYVIGDVYKVGDSYFRYEMQNDGKYGWSEYINKDVAIVTPIPFDKWTEDEMNEVLTNADEKSLGAIYRYLGPTTSTYTSGTRYVIVSGGVG